MPALRDITCSVRYAPNGIEFPEYGTLYGDGIVETYIAVPKDPCGFTISLKSNAYIFEGLAMVVFIDGTLNCNRNRTNLVPPNKTLPNNHSQVDFLVRQKEKALHSGTYMGRSWRFDNFNIVPDVPVGTNEEQFDLLGTIEVLVLRCRSQHPVESTMYDSSSGEDSHVMSDNSEDDDNDDKDGEADPAKAETSGAAEEGFDLPFARLFDGPADEPSYHRYMKTPQYARSGWNSRPYAGQPERYDGGKYPAPYYDFQRSPSPPAYRKFTGRRDSLEQPYHPYAPADRHVRFESIERDEDPIRASHRDIYARQATRPNFDPRFAEGISVKARRPRSPEILKQGERIPLMDDRRAYARHYVPMSDERYRDCPPAEHLPGYQHEVPISDDKYKDYPPQTAQPPPNIHALNLPFQQYPQIPGPYQPIVPVHMHQPYFQYPFPPPVPGVAMPFAPPMAMPFHTGPPPPFPVMGSVPFVGANRNVSASSKGSAGAQWSSIPGHLGPGHDTGPQPQQEMDHFARRGSAFSNQSNPGNAGTAGPNDASNTNTDANEGGWNSGNNDSGQTTNNNDNSNIWQNGGDQSTSWKNDDNQNNNDNANNWNATNDSNGNGESNGWGQGDSSGNDNAQNDAWNTDDNQNNQDTNNAWDTNNNENNQAGGWDTGNANQSNNGFNKAQSNSGGSEHRHTTADGPRPLYGPYGAYLDIARNGGEREPDAEEEPRYDVPRAVVDDLRISKQVQPGKGYLYLKKRSKPDYIDTLDKPYAKFVFKYRTTDQIEQELGIKLEVDPSDDKEVQELQKMDKQELIDMLLRAKTASGGQVPPPPPKDEQPRSTLKPVELNTNRYAFLDYDVLPQRNATRRTTSAPNQPQSDREAKNSGPQNNGWNSDGNNQSSSNWPNDTGGQGNNNWADTNNQASGTWGNDTNNQPSDRQNPPGDSNNNTSNSNNSWGGAGQAAAKPTGGKSAYPHLAEPYDPNNGQAGEHADGLPAQQAPLPLQPLFQTAPGTTMTSQQLFPSTYTGVPPRPSTPPRPYQHPSAAFANLSQNAAQVQHQSSMNGPPNVPGGWPQRAPVAPPRPPSPINNEQAQDGDGGWKMSSLPSSPSSVARYGGDENGTSGAW